MARKISFILAGSKTINAVANGTVYVVPADHRNYDAIKEAINKDDVDALERLVNVAKTIEVFAQGGVKVDNGIVSFNGETVHNTLTERILTMMRDGFEFQPMLKFLENLMENPSYRAVQELYTFLEHKGLPITEDGCFLGYKAVTSDWLDKHTKTISNTIGTVHSVPRRTVDDNWRLECSSGFHVGSLEYVKNFASVGDHILIVKVNPADVVAVPPNECTKLRTCKYEVVGEYDYNKLMESVYMPESPHTAQGTPITPTGGNGGYGYSQLDNDLDDYDDEDDDYDDEEDDDDDDYERPIYRGSYDPYGP